MNSSHTHQEMPLAVIGLACRLPGADDVDQFWQLLRSGGSGVAELPPDRFDRELYFHPAKGKRNKTYSAVAGLVSQKPFDRAACPLPEALVAKSDRAHLTLCEVAASACRHAGLDPFDLPLRNTGVYVGHTSGSTLAGKLGYVNGVAETAEYLREVKAIGSLPPAERDAVIRDVVSTVRQDNPLGETDGDVDLSSQAAAGLITRGFQLTGPFMTVDAACASSLQALMLAGAALQQDRIDMAIVGGASHFKTDGLVVFSQAQSLSANASCPFDADADGLILSEGYVVLVVKTVARALADGDTIQAVIRSIGMATDGRGKSLWAPRKEGQILSIQRAYGQNIDVAGLQYIEAHATSTQVGDATELQALAEALGGRLPAGKKIPIGSVKANIGHTLEAAGLAGLLKTILAMRNKIIPPAIHCHKLNPAIDWPQAPFFLPTTEVAWPTPADGQPRRAGVNCFGIGGLNTHVILDEFFAPSAGQLSSPAAIARPAVTVRSHETEAVACIGAGCILPGARTVEAFWELLASGRDAKTALPAERWNAAAGFNYRTGRSFAGEPPLGGFITDYAYDWKKHIVPPKQVANANPLQFMLLDAADEAFSSAGYDPKTIDRSRIGVVVGTVFGDEFSQQLNMGLRLPEFQRTLRQVLRRRGMSADLADQIAVQFGDTLIRHMPALIDDTGSFTSSTLASRITKSFDLLGGALALDAGSASGLAALSASVDILLNGACDLMVCAAGQRSMGLLTYEAWAGSGMLPAGAPFSPFDSRADGSVPGEGVGIVLLKRLSDARRDGDRIRAVIRGVGIAAGNEIQQTARLAMTRALDRSQIRPDQVGSLEIAASALPEIDSRHVAAIADTYGSAGRDRPLRIGSLTSQLGHTFAASGLAGFIKTTLSLEHKTLPANVALQEPAHWLAERAGRIETNRLPVPLAAENADRRMFSAVTANQGEHLVYHVLLEEGSNVAAAATAELPSTQSREIMGTIKPNLRIVRVGAKTLAELAAKAAALAGDCGSAFASAAQSAFAPAETWRLALVVDSVDALAAKLNLAASQISNPESRGALDEQGIHCREVLPGRPRVALLFPGQGSQYRGMLAELIRDYPPAMLARQEVDAAMALLSHPGFAEISDDRAQQLGHDVWRTQVAMLLADVIMFRALTSLGIEPDVISAHSYGEFPALVATGAWSLEQAIGATSARARAIESHGSGLESQMLSTTAAPDVVQRLLGSLPNVYLSHHNAPDQTVVAGQSTSVTELAARLRGEGFESRPLAVPRPFHTRLMADAQEPFRRALASVWIVPPQVPLVSSVSSRLVADASEIRENLVTQLVAPVHYVALIEQLAREGANVFVEVGPQQVLTRLHRRILAGRGAVITASDNPKRAGLEQLLRVQAQLECAGALGAPGNAGTAKAHATKRKPPSEPLVSEFVNFDATQRRRDKMRSGAGASPAAAQIHPAPARPAVASAGPSSPAPAKQNGAAAAGTDLWHGPTNGAAKPATKPQPPAAASPLANGLPSLPKPTKPAPPPAELEAFLVNFVIEQTGYPPEIVKLDADLEADLGIDSIKKAQLFGELGQYFEITVTDDLKLEDFPTLRHVVNFLRAIPAQDNGHQPAAVAKAEPAVLATPKVATPAPLRGGFADARPAAATMPSAAVAPAVAPAAPAAGMVLPRVGTAMAVVARSNAPPAAELEGFLVNFVVEQTGYPPEIVKLDADLEADLGIDSIKKAQLFGELGQYFDITVTDDLKLEDFPTLRHVVNFLRAVPGAENSPLPSAPLGVTATLGAAATASAAVAPAEALSRAGFGSGAAATATTRATATATALLTTIVAPRVGASTAVVARPNAPPAEELESFLVNFAVEQTGYPAEIVKLDADLEADLGIDSIKKAQLFGELGQYFDITVTDDLKLEDFPTLRHVLNFLQSQSSVPAAIEQVAPMIAAPVESVAPVIAPAKPAAQPTITPAAPQRSPEDPQSLPIVTLQGSAYEMGRQHGARQAAEIRRVLKRLADLPSATAEQQSAAGDLSSNPQQLFGAEQLEELRGIADGAGVHIGNILAHNLSRDADRRGGSVQVAIRAARNGSSGLIHAVGEQPPAASPLANRLSRIVQARHPANGFSHLTFSLPGELCGHTGINSEGLSVCSSPLSDRRPRSAPLPGRIHSAVVQAILQHGKNIDEAVEIARKLPKTGAWSMCIAHHPTDQLCLLEYDGESLQVRRNVDVVMSTNHCRVLEPNAEVPASSLARLQRLHEMLGTPATPVQMQTALDDHFEADSGHDGAGSTGDSGHRRSQVNVIMQPSLGDVWLSAKAAFADRADQEARLTIADLLQTSGAAASVPIATPILSGPAPQQAPEKARLPVNPPQSTTTVSPTERRKRVTERFVLRMCSAPLASTDETPLKLKGAALILGDNPLARALKAQLSGGQHNVFLLPANDGWDQTRDQFRACWARQPIVHLFLTTPHDEAARNWRGEAAWSTRRDSGMLLPFLLCQEWITQLDAASLFEGATLTAATALGGDFGLSGNISSLESGALPGLLKSLYIESLYESCKGMRFKAIDFSGSEAAADMAAAICRELSEGAPDLEVGFVRGERRVVRAVRQDADASRQNPIAPGGAWVVTGGGRGVTAAVAIELGRRFGVSLHLLGTSPEPQVDPSWRTLSAAGIAQLKSSIMRQADVDGLSPHEQWSKVDKALQIDRTLRACATAGSRATYHCCDVSDWRQLDSALQQIRQADGPIRGIVHGAAIIRDSQFLRKKPANVRQTLGAKVDAAAALMELTASDPLQHFIAFSSVSGRFGARGQSDYCMANDLLCKQVDWFRRERPECTSFAIHWHAWDDIGAAARPEVKAALASMNLELMPPAEGIEHLVREIEAGAGEGEVMFIDAAYYREKYPLPAIAAASDPQLIDAASAAEDAHAGHDAIDELPLIDSLREYQPGERLLAEVCLDPLADPFLVEHRMGGKPLLPIVVGLEALAQAARLLHGQEVTTIEGIEIHNALPIKDDRPRQVQVLASLAGEDQCRCQLSSEFHDREGRLVNAARLHVTGNVTLAPQLPDLEAEPAGEPPLGWFPMSYQDDAAIYHGPHFRCLTNIALQYDGGFGRIVAPPLGELGGKRIGAGWIIPLAALDSCLVACSTFSFCMFGKRVEIPHSFARIRLGRKTRPGEICLLRMHFRGQDAKTSLYDFTLFGADGQPILAVEGYRGVVISPGVK